MLTHLLSDYYIRLMDNSRTPYVKPKWPQANVILLLNTFQHILSLKHRLQDYNCMTIYFRLSFFFLFRPVFVLSLSTLRNKSIEEILTLKPCGCTRVPSSGPTITQQV